MEFVKNVLGISVLIEHSGVFFVYSIQCRINSRSIIDDAEMLPDFCMLHLAAYT